MYYDVYILYSEIFDKFLIGHTDNVTFRLKRHDQGKKGFLLLIVLKCIRNISFIVKNYPVLILQQFSNTINR